MRTTKSNKTISVPGLITGISLARLGRCFIYPAKSLTHSSRDVMTCMAVTGRTVVLR